MESRAGSEAHGVESLQGREVRSHQDTLQLIVLSAGLTSVSSMSVSSPGVRSASWRSLTANTAATEVSSQSPHFILEQSTLELERFVKFLRLGSENDVVDTVSRNVQQREKVREACRKWISEAKFKDWSKTN